MLIKRNVYFSQNSERLLNVTQKQFSGFNKVAKEVYKTTQNSPFSKEAMKGVNKLINRTRKQLENVSCAEFRAGYKPISAKRQSIIDQAITKRAGRIANISNNTEKNAANFLNGKQMENIIRH